MNKIKEMLHKEADYLSTNKDIIGKIPTDVMINILFEDGHTHGVYPKSEIAKELIEAALEDLDVNIQYDQQNIELPKRIIFHNRQAIGDILMFTCAIRDFKIQFPQIEVQVQSTAMHLWDHNKYINRENWIDIVDPMSYHHGKIKPTPNDHINLTRKGMEIAIQENRPLKVYIGPSKGTNSSNSSGLHFANAYRISIEDSLGVQIKQGPIRPDVYMTKDEYNAAPLIEPPYWLITAGEKGDWTCKTFLQTEWQKVVDEFKEIKFVQLGAKGHPHPELQGENVINYIGKTQGRDDGIRKLFNLFNYCEGSMGLISFQMHLAAAFGKPCVTIAGAREPVSFTRYNGHQYISSDGCLPCTINGRGESTACWFCDIKRCPSTMTSREEQEVPLCVGIINANDISTSIKKYYNGGRLGYDNSIGKSAIVNVVEQSAVHNAPKPKTKLDENLEKEGLAFGGGSITDLDFDFIKSIVEKYNIQTVLEFGCGLSTLLFKSLDVTTVSYETNRNWINKIKQIDPSVDIRLWNGKAVIDELDQFDLAFIDGPAGGENREYATSIGAVHGKYVIVHDAGRQPEKKWQDLYIAEKFRGPIKGGHRCHLWIPELIDVSKRTSTKKLMRMVFNGRGEGGAERSTTWIMNHFIDNDWDVEYIHTNSTPSGTFNKVGNPLIEITGKWERIQEPCDLLILYCNDWIWEFNKPELYEAFSNLKAKRKAMVVNFRLGSVGHTEWTRHFDLYLFLNTSLEATFKTKMPWANSNSIAPPTDLTQFFNSKPNYNGSLKIVRHNSQGDAKYPKNFEYMIDRLQTVMPNAELHLMPAPTFLPKKDNVITYKRNEIPIHEFLAKGNIFWYVLPDGYEDQGPKVIMEAQAVGLPVVSMNHSGPKDRVNSECGFLNDSFELQLADLQKFYVDANLREEMGKVGKKYARENYTPERWMELLCG